MGATIIRSHKKGNQPMNTFSEVQRFKIKWAWIVVIAFNVLFIYAIVQQIILGKPFGTKPGPNWVLVVCELGCLLLLIFIFSIRLKTTIGINGIRYRFYPFQFNTTFIQWHELSDAYIRPYNSFFEYGGYGIRMGSPGTGRAINTSESCNHGLQLQFNDGKLLLIGTKDPAAIQQILNEVMAGGKINRRI
jgi:hypothetical protein